MRLTPAFLGSVFLAFHSETVHACPREKPHVLATLKDRLPAKQLTYWPEQQIPQGRQEGALSVSITLLHFSVCHLSLHRRLPARNRKDRTRQKERRKENQEGLQHSASCHASDMRRAAARGTIGARASARASARTGPLQGRPAEYLSDVPACDRGCDR